MFGSIIILRNKGEIFLYKIDKRPMAWMAGNKGQSSEKISFYQIISNQICRIKLSFLEYLEERIFPQNKSILKICLNYEQT